jgi:hypothetical protein
MRLAPGRAATVVLVLLAVVFGGASWKLGYWVHEGPGPGLLPLVAAVALLISASVLLSGRPLPEEDRAFSPAALAGLALLAAYGAALPWAGLVLPSFLFATLWMKLLNQRRLWVSLLASAAIVAGGTLLFKALLGVPVPLWPEMP